MDVEFSLHGIGFVANKAKMAANASKHEVTFEQAAEVFFDPFLKMTDASSHREARDAVIGMDAVSHLLFVVHIVQENDRIRLISARKATSAERSFYENA